MADLNQMEKAPQFTSKVPDNLRHSMSKDEFSTWLADTLSVMDQRIEWTIDKLIEVNNVAVENNKQIKTWKKWIENPVAIILAIIVWLGPVTINRLLTHAEPAKTPPLPVAPAVVPTRDTLDRLLPDPEKG